MWNHRTIIVVGLALFFSALSFSIIFFRNHSPQPSVERIWQITCFENSKIIYQERLHNQSIANDYGRVFQLVEHHPHRYLVIEKIAEPSNQLTTQWRLFSNEDKRTIEFLILIPPATLLVCIFRNIIGLNSFGTFAPALLGLAFRDVHSPIGVFVVLTIVSVGWWIRRALNGLRLLQVPRSALLLSFIVITLLVLIFFMHRSSSGSITLFPIVILTGMIERFWSMEEEDGIQNSLRSLFATFFIALCVWLLVQSHGLTHLLFAYPETIGFFMSAQLLLGRYTGFRLLELYRFRNLMVDTTTTRNPVQVHQ